MRLVELIEADIYRDGGSYGARFLADDGAEYGLWLERSGMPDAAGLHHRWLFEFRGPKLPDACVPVVSGSDEEAAILSRLDDFLAAPSVRGTQDGPDSPYLLRRLRQLRRYICQREPTSAADLRQNGFVR
jgi:hypothetical protein